MKRAARAATVAALALLALAGPACAVSATWLADCSTGGATSGEILKNGTMVDSGLLPTNTLGASLLGTPLGPGMVTPGPSFGDIIEIKGLCMEDVTVTTSGLTLANGSNSHALVMSDGVQGAAQARGRRQHGHRRHNADRPGQFLAGRGRQSLRP